MSKIVLRRDPEVAQWVVNRVRHIKDVSDMGMFTTMGFVVNDKMAMGVVWNNYTGDDIAMTIAARDPKWCTKGTIKAVFRYPFVNLNCNRVSLLIAKSNKRARKLAEGMGFRQEGCLRKFIDREQDGIVYGMLKDECVWLKDELNG